MVVRVCGEVDCRVDEVTRRVVVRASHQQFELLVVLGCVYHFL